MARREPSAEGVLRARVRSAGSVAAALVLFLGGALFLGGCNNPPKHAKAPDHTAVYEAATRQIKATAAAKVAVEKAKEAHAKVRGSHAKETASIKELKPALSDLLRVTPPDLRPQVEAIQRTVDILDLSNVATAGFVEEGRKQISDADLRLGEAALAGKDLVRLTPEYFREVNKLAEDYNQIGEQLAEANKDLWWYRLRFWGAWVIGGLGVVFCLVLALMKALGRGIFAASQVAL